jgi:pimeloyl-ACP methyl ester carboxylesterase
MPFVEVAYEKIFYSFSSSNQHQVILVTHGSGGDHTDWPENFRNLPEAKVIYGDYSACNQFDIMEKAGEISLPTLVVSGTADKLTPVKYGEYLCQQIPGAQHYIIKQAGHMMALEMPDEFVRSVTDFLFS